MDGVVVDFDDKAVRTDRDSGFGERMTNSCRPAAWLGSTINGRVAEFFIDGMALKSRVLRVVLVIVRMPRSQRMIDDAFGHDVLADISNSSMVAANPRFSRRVSMPGRRAVTGNNLHIAAPIWIISAYVLTKSMLALSVASVTIKRPVSSRT